MIERLGADLAREMLKLPPEQQARARKSILAIVEAAKGLGDIPDTVMGVVWRLLTLFITKASFNAASAPKMFEQFLEGAGPLLTAAERARLTAAVRE